MAAVHEEGGVTARGDGALSGGEGLGDDQAAKDASGAGGRPGRAGVGEDVLGGCQYESLSIALDVPVPEPRVLSPREHFRSRSCLGPQAAAALMLFVQT